jgi:presenilin-like A22 family membrane protease
MKYKPKIAGIILAMFLVTQIIGLYVINYYSPTVIVDGVQENVSVPNQLPFGMEPPPIPEESDFWTTYFPSILFAFVIAIVVFFALTKFKAEFVLKAWFFVVVTIALSTSIMSFLHSQALVFVIIALAVALPLAFFKIFRQNFIIHNLTELLIYPGIAAVFVALLSGTGNPNRGVYSMIVLLIIISAYDMWAVWRSGIMQKMAKYQINKLKIFGGFFIPIVSRQLRMKLKKMKKSERKNKKIKVNIALLGGGDVVFPLITAGVVLRRFGFMTVLGLKLPVASLIVILGAMLGLIYLLLFSKKKKFYPAMPFISAGIFLALGLCYLLF